MNTSEIPHTPNVALPHPLNLLADRAPRPDPDSLSAAHTQIPKRIAGMPTEEVAYEH